MALELDPPQPGPIEEAVTRLLAEDAAAVDPWWEAGLVEALRGGDGPPAQDAWGGAGVVEA